MGEIWKTEMYDFLLINKITFILKLTESFYGKKKSTQDFGAYRISEQRKHMQTHQSIH